MLFIMDFCIFKGIDNFIITQALLDNKKEKCQLFYKVSYYGEAKI